MAAAVVHDAANPEVPGSQGVIDGVAVAVYVGSTGVLVAVGELLGVKPATVADRIRAFGLRRPARR